MTLPPYHQSQQMPTGRRTSPWLWVGLGAGTAVGAALLIGGMIYLFALFVDSGDFELDDSYYVEQGSVISGTAAPCEAMNDAARQVKVFVSPIEGSVAIEAVVVQMREIIAAIDDNSPDRDSRMWRDDWIRMADALEAYSGELTSDPSAEFVMPTVDDEPVSDRLYWSSDGCYVPVIIEALDPSASRF